MTSQPLHHVCCHCQRWQCIAACLPSWGLVFLEKISISVGSIDTCDFQSHKAECLPSWGLGFGVMFALHFLIFASLLAYRKCHQSFHPPTVTRLREVVKELMKLKFDSRDKKGGGVRGGGNDRP